MIDRNYAEQLDQQDPLAHFREQFLIPKDDQGKDTIYFCGNSLGLQSRNIREVIEQELKDWEDFGVTGHHKSKYPWYKYHEFLTASMAALIGAKPLETVVMNTLSVNLHLMMVSFYRPDSRRNKILIEYSSFPSDRYAVESQIRFHGFDPAECLMVLQPEGGSDVITNEQLEDVFKKHGHELALVLIGSVNYYTGQAYPIKKLCELAKEYACTIGFDLAHGAGNLKLNLHDDGPDFAIWCGYKYLNGGPGTLGGIFVHERHAHNTDLPRFAGWWGHDKTTRFQMRPEFIMMSGAEGWQLSNPPILPMACLRASLSILCEAGIDRLRKKSIAMGDLLFSLFDQWNHANIEVITPRDPAQRGAQLSIKIHNADKEIFNKLSKQGVIADWREPDVIRIAPVPLYNSFTEVYDFFIKLQAATND